MNKKTKLNVLRILFIISLIVSLFFISGTYAKYQEQMSTSYKSMIKRWKLVINDKIVREQQSLNQIVEPIFKNNEYVSDDVIVPGREGYFDLQVDFSKVDVPFIIDLFVEQYPTSDTYNNLPDFKFYGYYVEETDCFYYELPEGYQQVEYIESTGTQYIDTGIVADSNLVETSITFSPTKLDTLMYLGGAESTQKEDVPRSYHILPYIENDTMKFDAGDKINLWDMKNLKKDKFYRVDQSFSFSEEDASEKLIIKVNNEERYNRPYTGTIINNRNIWLFAKNDEEENPLYSFARVKQFKYYKNNNLVIELVPCYRKSDNVIGMFDIVSGTFFENSGTGEFLKGEDVTQVIIDPKLEKYKDLADEEKNTNVKAYVKWVDGDGTTESPVDILNNTEDTAFVDNVNNTDVKYKVTAVFEQYLED